MSQPFLKNIHHNLYEDKPITFNVSVCNDPSKKKKEYCKDYTKQIPKLLKNFGYIDIFVGKYPIYITTPVMVCPFGFNKDTLQMPLQFTNVNTNSEMKSFFEFIQNLELQQMKFLGLTEDDSDLYISQIRYDKENKYDPTLSTKIPFKYNRFEVDIHNRDYSSCSIYNIHRFCKVKCDIYIDKIWPFNGSFICKWKIRKIEIIP
jgi:hypothetical protein